MEHRLTLAQITAARDAVISYLVSLGVQCPPSVVEQVDRMLKRETRPRFIFLPPNERNIREIFVANGQTGYVMSIHTHGGKEMTVESEQLKTVVDAAIEKARFQPLEVCAGAVEAYRYLRELEFARRDVSPVVLGFMTIYMFEAQNAEYIPANNDRREGRRLAYEAFQQVVADMPRVLDTTLVDDCFVALLAVVMQLEPPAGMDKQQLIVALLERISDVGDADV